MGKNIAYGAVFGVLWGITEGIIGTLFHRIHLPFTGEILSALAILILSFTYLKSSKKEVIIITGIIAIIIKLTFMGSIFIGPVISIGLLSLPFYAGLITFTGKKAIYFAGILAGSWSPFYFGIIKLKFIGPELLTLYEKMFKKIGIIIQPTPLIIIIFIVGWVLALLGVLGAIWLEKEIV